MIKNNILILLIVANMFCVFSQSKKYPENPMDTLFCGNGQIKSVFFEKEFFSTRGAPMKRYFKKVCDTSLQTQDIDFEVTENHNWKVKREYHKDSLVVIKILDHKMFRPVIDKASYKILLNLRKDKPLGIYFLFNKEDSLVSKFRISRPDSLRYTVINTFHSSNYSIPTSFTKKVITDLDRDDKLTISFYDKYYMRQILYQWQDENNNWVNTVVNFDYKNVIVNYGHYYPPNGRQGKWYEYYPNRVLKSEGAYSRSDFEGTKEVKKHKTGIWKYYSEDNCLTKLEIWKNGKLLKMEKF